MATEEQKRAELRSILTPEELAQLDEGLLGTQVKYINSSEEQRAGRPGRSADDPPPHTFVDARGALRDANTGAVVAKGKSDERRREIESIRMECLAKGLDWARIVQVSGNAGMRFAKDLVDFVIDGQLPSPTQDIDPPTNKS